jgi:hypothetical protein
MSLKDQVTQALLRHAIQCRPRHQLPWLQTMRDSYYLRRDPLTLPPPPPILSSDSLAPVEHPWNSQMVYVEPHLTNMCRYPAKVAHWIAKHGALRGDWLPVQHVSAPHSGYAFVILSGEVESASLVDPELWRSYWPKDWIVMTKYVPSHWATQLYSDMIFIGPNIPSERLNTQHCSDSRPRGQPVNRTYDQDQSMSEVLQMMMSGRNTAAFYRHFSRDISLVLFPDRYLTRPKASVMEIAFKPADIRHTYKRLLTEAIGHFIQSFHRSQLRISLTTIDEDV